MRAMIDKLNRFLEIPLGPGPRGLLVLALVLLVPSYLVPLYDMTMFAPQYRPDPRIPEAAWISPATRSPGAGGGKAGAWRGGRTGGRSSGVGKAGWASSWKPALSATAGKSRAASSLKPLNRGASPEKNRPPDGGSFS